MRVKVKSVKQIMARKLGQFNHLLHKIDQMQILTQILHKYLDPQLAQHCRVANRREGTVIIAVDSPAWATRIKYALPDVLTQMRYGAGLHDITNLRCIVAPMPKEDITHKPPRTLSKASGDLLRETAQSIEDPVLSQALLRLAKRAKHG